MELGTASNDVVAAANKYPWANSSFGAVAVRRHRLLHSLYCAKTHAAKNWGFLNRFHGSSLVFLLSQNGKQFTPRRMNSATDKGFEPYAKATLMPLGD
jgi:hypothetical protein